MKKYLIDYKTLTIEKRMGEDAELAFKIHPERCFDKFHTAKQALIKHCKSVRDKANDDIQKVYRLTDFVNQLK